MTAARLCLLKAWKSKTLLYKGFVSRAAVESSDDALQTRRLKMQGDHPKKPFVKAENTGQRQDTDFTGIRDLFQDLGVLGERLHIEHEGNMYRVSCDEKAFMVYRVNHGAGAKYGVPGWPVCLVTPESAFEEFVSPGIGDDHCACGIDLRNWLDIVHYHCR